MLVVALIGIGTAPSAASDEKAIGDELAARLRTLTAKVFSDDAAKAQQLPQMLAGDARARLRAANARESLAWQEVKTRADWEQYRDPRLRAPPASPGPFPPVPESLNVRVTGKHEGDGYRVENVVFESRPGLLVTANLYLPATPARSMPGIL